MKLTKELQDILNISSHCGDLPTEFVAYDIDDNKLYEFYVGTKSNFIDLENGCYVDELNKLGLNDDDIVIVDLKNDKLIKADLDDIKNILKLCTVPLQFFKDDDTNTLEELHKNKIAVLINNGNECSLNIGSEIGYFNDFVKTIFNEIKNCNIDSVDKEEILETCKRYDKACKANLIPVIVDTVAKLYELKLKYNLYANEQVIGFGVTE